MLLIPARPLVPCAGTTHFGLSFADTFRQYAETARLGSSQKQPCLSPKREPPAAIWQMKTKADKQYAKADQRRSVPILIRHTKPAQRRLRAT